LLPPQAHNEVENKRGIFAVEIAMTRMIVQSIRPKNKNTTAALTLTASEISCLSALSRMSESSITTTRIASRITRSHRHSGVTTAIRFDFSRRLQSFAISRCNQLHCVCKSAENATVNALPT
jgi:hypothetical protein